MAELNHLEKFNQVLNDLIHINYEHVKLLKKAVSQLESPDHDLIPVFDEMISKCRVHLEILHGLDFSKGKETMTGGRKPIYEDSSAEKRGALSDQWLASDFQFNEKGRSAVIHVCAAIIQGTILAYEQALNETSIQNVNPVIQRDLNIQLSAFRAAERRLKTLG